MHSWWLRVLFTNPRSTLATTRPSLPYRWRAGLKSYEGNTVEATHTFNVSAAPELVWRYLSDPTTWPQWMPTVRSVEPSNGTVHPSQDATYALKRKGDFEGELRITSFIPQREFAFNLSGSATPASGSYTLQDNGNGSVDVTSTLETGAISSAVLTVFGGGKGKVEDQLAADGRGLRSLVEQPAAPQAPAS